VKLVVPVPPDWEQLTVEDGVLFQAPSQIFGMLVTRMGPAPVDPESWIRQAFMYRAHDTDGEPRDLALSRFTTREGWSAMRLDGALGTQGRFVTHFGFLDYAATVIAMCRDPIAQPTWREQILGIIAEARPDFSEDRVICLAHQLGLVPIIPSLRRGRLVLAGWQRSFVGGDLVLTGENGPSVGAIRITIGTSPIATVPQILDARLALLPDSTRDRLVIDTTDEGEHAVIANVTSSTEQRTLGVVFADTSYTTIEAVATVREQFPRFRAAVHELTYSTTLGLGAGRWRRFFYEPPPGWVGVARPRGALWISPSCPRVYQVMRVFDARPPADHELLHGARMFETLPLEFYREPPKGPVSYWTTDDLECRVSVYTGRLPNRTEPIRILDGTIVTETYIYPIRMECDQERFEDSMRVFERVVASVRPVPGRRAQTAANLDVMSFWVD
jgi:hypothetical protein